MRIFLDVSSLDFPPAGFPPGFLLARRPAAGSGEANLGLKSRLSDCAFTPP